MVSSRYLAIATVALVAVRLSAQQLPKASASTAQLSRGQVAPVVQPGSSPNGDTYGTSAVSFAVISSVEFTGYGGSTYSDDGNHITRFASGANNTLAAGVHLPSGATILAIYLDSCETNATLSTSLEFLECTNQGNCSSSGVVGAIPNAGCGRNATLNFVPGQITVHNDTDRLFLWVATPAGDVSTSLQDVAIEYQLQVSQPPGVADFVDVPTTSPIYKFVEALKTSGITAGCDATHYCPNASVTRGQMAVFLSTALGLQWP
jgi:hypothetical protein